LRASEIRSRFLEFFRERGHTVCPSDSLVPTGDASLLFTGAGMNQFKDYFLGVGTLPFRRAVSVQKCFRTGDLENVGKTPHHLTFFEMLGNFSFGDYFKEEAIAWAWEFLTQDMGFPTDRLAVSVYREDDEAYEVWKRKIGVHPDRIFRFGAKDNFWPANAPQDGPNGPCGPCSEIFFDFDPSAGRKGGDPSTSDRFAEIWNLVFTQFDRKPDGSLDPLPQKNIDTGMGFERLVAVSAGQRRVSETELFLPMLEEIGKLAGGRYDPGEPEAVRMRRIADHARAVTFCIADGVIPSNEGRGYVERRLIRRAINDAHRLGVDGPFLHRLVPLVHDIMGDAYPEIATRARKVAQIVREEEERFGQTYARGLQILDGWIDEMAAGRDKTLGGERAFQLYDTYGFPLDLAAQILAERGFGVDREGFETLMEAQRERARGRSKIASDIFDRGPLKEIRDSVPATEFVGYEAMRTEAKVVGLVVDDRRATSARAGQAIQLVVDRTPFYAEAGGQLGDVGEIRGDGLRVRVDDTRSTGGIHVHAGTIEEGEVREGMPVVLEVDEARRRAIMRNHTATHLLHRALREVLGDHAEQAGSLVAPDRLRFDFTHAAALSLEEIREIEDRVNRAILADRAVRACVRPYREALADGAMALFGEKYGSDVRVVEVEATSKELCGGTHVARTGEIGPFRVVAEGSIASGIRRIEALTGEGALARSREERDLLRTVCERLKVPEDLLLRKIDTVLEEAKTARAALEKARRGNLGATAGELASSAESLEGGRLLVRSLEGLGPKELREVADQVRRVWTGERAEGALVLGSVEEGGKVHLIAAATSGLAGRRVHAGEIVRDLARALGGGGGGRPDLAQGQGADGTRLEQELAGAGGRIRKSLGGSDPA